jgi:hypothetical protein
VGVFEPSSFLRDAAIAAAHELGLFEALAAGARTPPELAAALGVADSHRLRALIDVLAAIGAIARGAGGLTAGAITRGAGGLATGAITRGAGGLATVDGARGAAPTLVATGGAVAAPTLVAAGGAVAARPAVVAAGWGLLADVIRRDRPLPLEPADEARYHRHLLAAGAPAARELAPRLGGVSLLDLGGGAGAYTAAFLDAHPGSTATLVDTPATVALAEAHLARFGDRVRFMAGDARTACIGDGHGAALLANVLHLHPAEVCAELCAAAARAIAPGGLVAIVDLRVDEDRGGPLEGLLFALNMALYTEGGDVHPASRIRGWLADAGLVEIEARPLASAPEAMIVTGRRPRLAATSSGPGAGAGPGAGHPAEVAISRELARSLAAAGEGAWRELAREGALLEGADPPRLAFPAPLLGALARAVAHERAEAAGDPATSGRAAALLRHYTELMPRARVALLAGRAEPAATFFHARLDWARLPRLGAAIDRLYALLAEAGANSEALGAPSPAAFRARTPTLAALYARTCYGGAMPLLYGTEADLAYFHERAIADGLELHEAIDRYFTAPMVHELCHFAARPGPSDRPELPAPPGLPLHLDECIAGWLGVHVHPELAYPAPGHDDAIFAAPWLSQVGQAIARAFGVHAVVRAHAGAAAQPAGGAAGNADAAAPPAGSAADAGAAALPAPFAAAAARLGWDDWLARRTLHFLSDTLDPDPWVGLALAAGAGLPLANATLAELARLPPAAFAALPDDPAFDLAIVADGLRAMCLRNERRSGAFRTCTALPATPITIDATGRISLTHPDPLLGVAPRYWLPPAVCARISSAGHASYELHLGALAAIPEAAAAICAAAASTERAHFALRPRSGRRSG